MDKLLKEYREQLKRTNALKRNLPNETPEEKEDHRILTGIITDLEIAVHCLKTGTPPGYRRKGVYGTTAVDPFVVAQVFQAADPFEEVENRIDKERELQHA